MENSEECSSIDIINSNLEDCFALLSLQNKCKNAGICTDEKCVQSIEKRLPPVHQPIPKDEEAWGVKFLPTNWVPVSKPSKVIENLMKKRQAQHEAVIERVKAQFELLNSDIETQIRVSSETLKRDFAEIEKVIHQSIESLGGSNDTILKLCKENFEAVLNIIQEQHKKHTAKIEEFYVYLQNLEKLRADEFKKVLRSAYEDLHQTSYQLPYELQQYFEHEILKVNQMLLSNHRCYADLQSRLHLQAENTNRLQRQKLADIKGRWRDTKKRDVLIKLNEMILVEANCEALMLQTEQGKAATKLFMDKEQNLVEAWTHLSPLQLTTEELNIWTTRMQSTVNGLDQTARKLITLYKTAIDQVFNGYFDELRRVQEEMLDLGLSDSVEIGVPSLEVCKATIDTATKKYSEELNSLEITWNDVITRLQNKMQNMYVFLHSAAHLWDLHFERLKEAKRIVLKDLKKVIGKNDTATQGQEVKINRGLDILRQAATTERLKIAMGDVVNNFNLLKEIYKAHYGSEVKTIEKYGSLVDVEVQVLLAELSLFLTAHPTDPNVDPTQKKHRASDPNAPIIKAPTLILPQQMKLCEYQVDAVQNWMFGLWEAIDRYRSTCKEEISQQASVWISENVKKIAKRFEVKLAFHAAREGRVGKNVYEIRLAEIKTHSERLERHKAGAEKEVEDIRQDYSIYESKYARICSDYQKKICDINSKIEHSTNTGTIKAYLADLNYNTSQCNKKIDQLKEDEECLYSLKMCKIRKTAIEFSNQIRLFLEDGNFNSDETKNITKDFKTIEKSTKKQLTTVKKEIQVKERKMVQQIQYLETDALFTLTNSLEEFEFNDQASSLVRNLQADIRTEAYNIKCSNKKLRNTFNELENNQIINLGDAKYCDAFLNVLEEFVSALLEVNSQLYQLDPVINVSTKPFETQIFETPPTRIDPRNSASVASFADITNLLFEITPTQSDSFMSKICCHLYKSLATVQSVAKEFYGKHTEIRHTHKVQLSYDAFMKEVLAKYNFYHLQCELLWLDQVNAFIKLIQVFLQFTSHYQKSFMDEQCNLHITALLEKHKEFVNKVITIKDDNKQLLNRISDKLKPLHGHKGNKQLLDELQREMAEAVALIRAININELIQPLMESQEEHLVNYETELSATNAKLAAMCSEAFDKLLHLPLIEQFQEKIMAMIALINEKHVDVEQEKVEDQVADEKSYFDKIKHMEVAPEYQENLTNFKQLYQTHTTNIETKEKFNAEFKQCTAHVYDIKTTWYDDVDRYEKMFEANVQKVLKLYAVKYDNPLP